MWKKIIHVIYFYIFSFACFITTVITHFCTTGLILCLFYGDCNFSLIFHRKVLEGCVFGIKLNSLNCYKNSFLHIYMRKMRKKMQNRIKVTVVRILLYFYFIIQTFTLRMLFSFKCMLINYVPHHFHFNLRIYSTNPSLWILGISQIFISHSWL